jgi:conjugative relaxase-like TrwC/TraI family protein
MVKISKAQGSGAAANYFEKEYSNVRESYYMEGEPQEIEGEYFGELAKEMGLTKVTEETFHRLIEGQDPHTGEQRVRHVASKTYTDKFGNVVKTMEHRAGRDIVLSCPDTFSLCYGPGGDKRIAQWQREASKETLAEIEEYVAAKNGGKGEVTGKMIGALFQHDCARPDRETGYAAPNLHDHFFMMNMTKDERGRWRAVEIDTLFKVRDFATMLHWSKLAEKARAGGYEIEINPRTGAPEIAGFSDEYLAENSRRRQEVLRHEARLKAEARERGIVVDDASLRSEAARMDRRSKKFDREEMQARHIELDAKYRYPARRAVERGLARDQAIRQENPQLIKESVSYGVEQGLDSEAVALRAEIEGHALWRGQYKISHEEIKAEINGRIKTGELIEIARGRGPEMTSRAMLQLERENIARMKAGQGKNRQIVHPDSVDAKINDAAEKNLGFHLNRSQHQAVRAILTSEDQIMGLQGYAGVGKTTTLKALNSVLRASGYEVRGLAPQGRPAKLLADAGIQATTLQKFIASPLENEPIPRYYILDESSLADTKGMNTFLRRLRRIDRVLEVGDIKQHQPVNAGVPFEQRQRAGMHTAVIDDIQRQKDPGLKKVVELFAKGQPRKATELLIQQGRVKEVEDAGARITAIAKDYAASPNAIVICTRNSEREQTNREIHAALQDLGQVERAERRTMIYVGQDVTGAKRKVAAAYQVGDHIRYTIGSKQHGIKAGEYREVVKVDAENNTLTVMNERGRLVEYDPKRLKGVAVYREEERDFSVGDRIQFRAPYPGKRITTNEIAYVEKIDGDRMTVRMDDEKQKQITIDLSTYKHIDYGFATTSYSSQGLGAYRAIINANAYERAQLLNERMGYVADSRAEHDVTIYTNSKADLPYALARASDKETAIDALLTSEQRKELIQQQRAAEIARQRAPAWQTEQRQEQSRNQRPESHDSSLSR